jgi:putative drug exporter of the RND superfamily
VAAGVFIDAVDIRSALVPALMLLLGKANWWLPRWLDRALPRVNVEAEPDQGIGPIPDRPPTLGVP